MYSMCGAHITGSWIASQAPLRRAQVIASVSYLLYRSRPIPYITYIQAESRTLAMITIEMLLVAKEL